MIIDIHTTDYSPLHNENIVGGDWFVWFFTGVLISSVIWLIVLHNNKSKKENNSNSDLWQ